MRRIGQRWTLPTGRAVGPWLIPSLQELERLIKLLHPYVENYAEWFFATPTGVGVGTETPAQMLDVVGRVQVQGSVGAFVLQPRDGTGTVFAFYNPTGDALLVDVSGVGTRFQLTKEGNFGVGLPGFGASAANVFAVGLGTAPTTSPTDTVQLWAADVAAGMANLFARNENGQVERLTGCGKRLAAQFNKTNTTLADVTGLSFNVEAGKTYAFAFEGDFDASAAGGHKYAIAGTCTATAIIYHVRSIADATGAWTASRHTALASATAFAAGPVAGHTTITGTITVANAGTLLAQFAQQVASGTSSLLRGATLSLREIT